MATNHEFQPGDRVIYTYENPYFKGKKGTFVEYEGRADGIGVVVIVKYDGSSEVRNTYEARLQLIEVNKEELLKKLLNKRINLEQYERMIGNAKD